MARIPTLVPITDLRQDAAAVMKRLRESKQPVLITQRGRAVAVLQSMDVFERAEAEHELLRLLAQGEREIAAGHGHDLTDVLAEADALLADDER